MMRSMFAGVSGLRTHQTMMDVIGDNIANVNSSGFKTSRTVFQDTLSQVVRDGAVATGQGGAVNPQQVGLGVELNAIDKIMTQGAIQSTGRPSDLAIVGNGYFALRLVDGTTAYTRSGSFTLDPEGRLVDPAGGLLLAPGGEPLQIQAQNLRSFSISRDGNVNIVTADGAASTAGKVGLAVFPNPAGLIKSGNGRLQWSVAASPAPPPVVDPGTAGSGTLSAGALEMSNVDLAQEFTNMIIAQRGFQANSKIISTSDEMLQEVVNIKR